MFVLRTSSSGSKKMKTTTLTYNEAVSSSPSFFRSYTGLSSFPILSTTTMMITTYVRSIICLVPFFYFFFSSSFFLLLTRFLHKVSLQSGSTTFLFLLSFLLFEAFTFFFFQCSQAWKWCVQSYVYIRMNIYGSQLTSSQWTLGALVFLPWLFLSIILSITTHSQAYFVLYAHI